MEKEFETEGKVGNTTCFKEPRWSEKKRLVGKTRLTFLPENTKSCSVIYVTK